LLFGLAGLAVEFFASALPSIEAFAALGSVFIPSILLAMAA
jgi:hypothetical protein